SRAAHTGLPAESPFASDSKCTRDSLSWEQPKRERQTTIHLDKTKTFRLVGLSQRKQSTEKRRSRARRNSGFLLLLWESLRGSLGPPKSNSMSTSRSPLSSPQSDQRVASWSAGLRRADTTPSRILVRSEPARRRSSDAAGRNKGGEFPCERCLAIHP